MAPFTVQLLSLRCLESQEMDGDEIYIHFNREKIWAVPQGLAMHHRPIKPQQFDEFDFENGRLRTHTGWKPVEPFEPARFIFPHQEGAPAFQLWEADFITSDDHLGSSSVSAADAGRGTISLIFDADGARYRLTYRVTSENPPVE